MNIESAAFKDGGNIPKRHTCEGSDASPPLAFSSPPAAAKSLGLICDDPDAPGGAWTHWVLFNLPSATKTLDEGLPKTQFVHQGASQGINDFGRLGYGGPCPPPGKAHRYVFALYALDSVLELKPGASKEELLEAMEGRTLARAQLIGLYRR